MMFPIFLCLICLYVLTLVIIYYAGGPIAIVV
jgi:hypothetical protein